MNSVAFYFLGLFTGAYLGHLLTQASPPPPPPPEDRVLWDGAEWRAIEVEPSPIVFTL